MDKKKGRECVCIHREEFFHLYFFFRVFQDSTPPPSPVTPSMFWRSMLQYLHLAVVATAYPVPVAPTILWIQFSSFTIHEGGNITIFSQTGVAVWLVLSLLLGFLLMRLHFRVMRAFTGCSWNAFIQRELLMDLLYLPLCLATCFVLFERQEGNVFAFLFILYYMPCAGAVLFLHLLYELFFIVQSRIKQK